MLPPYSVLMSVYDKEQAVFLTASLTSMAVQTHMPNEIVLVCDGALTPELTKAIEEFGDQYPDLLQLVHLEHNVGLGEALNQGLRHCRYEYIARMDTDDISLPQRIELQLTYMMQNQLDVCGGNIVEFNDNNTVEYVKAVPQGHADILRYAKKRNPFNHPSVVFKKSVVLDAGGYQPMSFFEDYFLWVRVLKSGARCGNVPETLLRMRSNADFYARRGGVTYCRSLAAFWRQAAKIGFITQPEASSNTITRFIVALLPNWLRKRVYQYLLRA